MLIVITLYSVYAECHNADFCNAQYRYTECCFAEYRYAECHNEECNYDECHYAEYHYAERHYDESHYAECHCPNVIMLNAIMLNVVAPKRLVLNEHSRSYVLHIAIKSSMGIKELRQANRQTQRAEREKMTLRETDILRLK